MKRIGEDIHLSTLESVAVIAAFFFALCAMFFAFGWATSK